MKLIIQVALGIILAGVLVFGAKIAFVSFTAHQLKQEQIAKQETRQKEAQLKEDAALKAKIEKELDLEIARKAAAKKEKAWKKFYQPTAECLNFKSVDCVNEEIRMKVEFEKHYKIE